jgi:hypothetical protein
VTRIVIEGVRKTFNPIEILSKSTQNSSTSEQPPPVYRQFTQKLIFPEQTFGLSSIAAVQIWQCQSHLQRIHHYFVIESKENRHPHKLSGERGYGERW